MIPLATTTITVLRVTPADLDAEPYNDDTQRLTQVTTGVRAVVDRPQGRQREQVAGGEQVVWDFELVCDMCDLNRLDTVRDDTTGMAYRVTWIWSVADGINDHIEAGLRFVEGEI